MIAGAAAAAGQPAVLRVLDLFSCLGSHAKGLHATGGFRTVRFVEINPYRRARLARLFPGIPIDDDVRTYDGIEGEADLIIGGPPCQRTSVLAAIHGRRSGETLWPEQGRITARVRPGWVVVEQPPGNAAWEANVARDLARLGYCIARAEFAASDLGAPHQRRRVFLLAHRDLPRLEIAWRSIPSEIARFARSGPDRNPWVAGFAGSVGVDAGDGRGRVRQERIEAIGDSNPPAMAEVIGLAILTAVDARAAA